MASSMARDWRTYWNTAAQLRDRDPLRQVGKTVRGVPVCARLVSVIATSISSALRLRTQDAVLELCCCNGLITFMVAERCAEIMAMDFSEPLIATARQRYARENICYVVGDAAALSGPAVERRFDKVFMLEALQHFTPRQVDDLLSCLAASASRKAPVFLGSIPDAERLRNFYDTPARYRQYCESVARGLEPIGTWWRQDDLVAMVERHGYRATVLKQDADLHTAHYRFDLLCEPA
jgi:cyclopropane fatty-acyl-phospholipid synthase-like methyltransferase